MEEKEKVDKVSPPDTEIVSDEAPKVEMTPEEMEQKKDEIKHNYAKMITFSMYKGQIKQICAYAVKERKSIDDMKEEVSKKISPLPSAARKFIKEIKVEAMVELAAMLNVDFTHDYPVNQVVTQISNGKEIEHENN